MPATLAFKHPRLEHIAIWNKSIDKAVTFFEDALGWKRHPIEFGIDGDNPTFGGPRMDLLKTKCLGFLVVLCFEVDDMDKTIDTFKSRGIELRGVSDEPLIEGGLLQEWVIDNDVRRLGDERVASVPAELAHSTAVEMFWEYKNDVLNPRDEITKTIKSTAKIVPPVDTVVVLGEEVEKPTAVYTDTMKLERTSYSSGIPRDWMGIKPVTKHSWIHANHVGFFVKFLAPHTPAAQRLLSDSHFGEDCIIEPAVEVRDLTVYHDELAVKGYQLTAGDCVPLSSKSYW